MNPPALYRGIVTHQRFRPKPHRLRYRMAQILVDIDELDSLARRMRFFSRNRFNLVAFHDRDYAGRNDRPLRQQIEALLADRATAAILNQGLMPLLSIKDSDGVSMVSFQSLAEPSAPLRARWR